MARYSRRTLLAAGGTSASIGLVGYHADNYTKARIASILSPLPGIRATGKPLTVRKKAASKVVEYLPKTNEVRIVIARDSEGTVEYATRPFEQWAELECGSIATEEVQLYIQGTFSAHGDIMSGMGFGNGQPFVSTAPTGPAVTRKEMVEQFPNHVTVTIMFADKEYTTDIPVIVKERQEIHLV
ncbi:hypothetical protein [Haladaptatus halobius]|uniref:hypothetical protein n=1 Tax=Haladaptatus halobius TaxID=2884875 RepID=UPI001D09FE5A|nr:hypothetical protein [Haladaptatus halobius]